MIKILSKIIFLLILYCGNNLIYSQENKIDVLISGGSNTQSLDFGERTFNLSSYTLNLGVSYNFSKEIYLKSGVNFGGLASVNDFEFNTYQIPVLLGFNIYPTGANTFRFFAEFGPHYRGIYDFKDFSTSNYKEKESFGFIFNTGMHFDLNRRFYSKIYLNTNREFGDSFTSDDNEVRMKSYAIMMGIGLKF